MISIYYKRRTWHLLQDNCSMENAMRTVDELRRNGMQAYVVVGKLPYSTYRPLYGSECYIRRLP
jgi:hypothetical protein